MHLFLLRGAFLLLSEREFRDFMTYCASEGGNSTLNDRYESGFDEVLKKDRERHRILSI